MQVQQQSLSKGFSGHTALHYAAYQDNWAEIVPILLDTGLLNVMERNYHGKTRSRFSNQLSLQLRILF